jgi:carboxymethylenebutenolidase
VKPILLNRSAPLLFVAALLTALPAVAAPPQTVYFKSGDGVIDLTAYLWQPTGAGPFPAVVMLHGRAGSYSNRANGVYNATTLTQRYRQWGEYWAAQGYLALHVDSFGPRGYGGGFAIHSYRDRPPAVSDQSVRPLDAEGALAYLRTRADVIGERIGVFGWSNGAMSVLAELAHGVGASGFQAAVALYPGCRAHVNTDYRPYAPLLLLLAGNDQEVSPAVCETMAKQLHARGAELEYRLYAGARHAFDDPGASTQSVDANREATADARRRSSAFFARHLKTSPGQP